MERTSVIMFKFDDLNKKGNAQFHFSVLKCKGDGPFST